MILWQECYSDKLQLLLSLCPLTRSFAAGKSLAGSTAWRTSAPACHSSRAACPKSGWPLLPYSPASARSSTEQESWRRRRTPPPPPPWRPCHHAHLPPPARPPCLVSHATSPAGRSCKLCWESGGWTCGSRERQVPAAADESSYSQTSCLAALELLCARGKNVSQTSTMARRCGGNSLLTKAGNLLPALSEHCWRIPTSNLNISNEVWFIISQDGSKAAC